MISDFEKGILVCLEDGFAIAERGMEPLFDIFKHLSEGGTVNNHPEHDAMTIDAMMSATYVTLQHHLSEDNNSA